MPVVSSAVRAEGYVETRTWADRLGMPGVLRWGYIGLLVFMIGDGVESGYLAVFLGDRGFTDAQVGLMFTVYGVAAGLAAWASGALSDLWGPRRVMMIGLAIWVVFQVLVLAVALPSMSYPLMLVSYGLRGLGYPLFAYGFLVWIAAATPQNKLGSAVGWFWFAFTGGLPTLGSLLASVAIPRIGELNTLWVSLGLVAAGGIFAIAAVRERTGYSRLAPPAQKPLATLASSLTIMRKPKIAAGAVVRAINTASQFGILVCMPAFFTKTIGFELTQWLQIVTVIFTTNIFFNLLFGIIGDKVGWRQTVALFGGIGCGAATLAFYYVPLAVGPNLAVAMGVGALYGATLAAFVPLSALMPSLAPDRKGAAMSALNLGAGASAFLGPLVVTLALGPFGVAGVMWTYAVLYLISAILAWQLRLPKSVEKTTATDRVTGNTPIGSLAGMAGNSLLGHPPVLHAPEDNDIDLILFDVGGTIYDDNLYAQALWRAVHELNPAASELDFWAEYDEQRERGTGSLRTALAQKFVGGDRARLAETAAGYWDYPPDALYHDVRPALSVLSGRYRLGLVANSPVGVLDALEDAGLRDMFSVVALASQVGAEKPDPVIFTFALTQAGVPANRAVYVGNRLDTDIRPARTLGMRTVWMLRGEATPAPTGAQLEEPDAVITSLTGLTVVLARITGARELVGAPR